MEALEGLEALEALEALRPNAKAQREDMDPTA